MTNDEHKRLTNRTYLPYTVTVSISERKGWDDSKLIAQAAGGVSVWRDRAEILNAVRELTDLLLEDWSIDEEPR